MREIKFRGKRLDNGEWVHGYLLEKYTVDSIPRFAIDECWSFENDEWTSLCVYEVNPATVGQFTGLHDKNGKEIYEGDIVLATLKFFNINNKKCKIIFHNGSFGVQYGFSPDYFKPFSAWDEVEVIDNIYDNEMIKIENTDVASQIKYELMSKQ